MSIHVACTCGRVTKVKDEYAGRSIHCSACRADLNVPVADAGATVPAGSDPQPAGRRSPRVASEYERDMLVFTHGIQARLTWIAVVVTVLLFQSCASIIVELLKLSHADGR